MALDLLEHLVEPLCASDSSGVRRSQVLPTYGAGLRGTDPDATGARTDPAEPPHLAAGRARTRLLREVEAIASAAPDESLAAWLDDLDPTDVPVEILVEAVAASARLEAAAHARTLGLAAALARRPEMEPAWNDDHGPLPRHRSVAADELSMRLGVSRVVANRLVREGQVLDLVLPATGAALAAGELDAAKVSVLVQRLGNLDLPVAEAVEDLVLPEAPERSTAQVRLDVERALREVDPDGSAARHEHARSERRVSRPRPEPDGMASMWLVLAAEDAARVDGVLEHTARAARVHGDPRTLDQIRADGLRDLVVGDVSAPSTPPEASSGLNPSGPVPLAGPFPSSAVPLAGPVPSDRVPPAGAGCACGGRAGAQVRVTVAASTLLGLDDRPGELVGYGPVDAVTARALAAGGTWRRIVTDPLSGAVLDVGRTRYRPPAALDEHVRIRDRHCAAPGCTVPALGADLDHTLEFHGPPARPREQVAAPSGDRPTPGHGPDGGPAGRTDGRASDRCPPDRLRTIDPPPEDPLPLGTTADTNLGVLCRRHHRLKTDGGFRLRQLRPGVYEWVTPGGHRYLTRPGTDAVVDVSASAPSPHDALAELPPPF